MNTCRFCKLTDYDNGPGELVNYGIRHWAHGPCLYERKGVGAVAALPRWMIERLPVILMRRAGVDLFALLRARDAVTGTTGSGGPLGRDATALVVERFKTQSQPPTQISTGSGSVEVETAPSTPCGPERRENRGDLRLSESRWSRWHC